LAIGVLAAILTNECLAGLNGSDDFNDNSKDATWWGTDFISGVGSLTETNGRLEYTTTGVPTAADFAVRPWILNFGSYTQDWEVQIDISMPQLTLAPTQFVSLGLFVFPGTNINVAYTNRFYADFDQDGSDHEFKCQVAVNTSNIHLGVQSSVSTSAAVRVAFDATTKVLAAYYDEDGPVCGYSWKLLGSTNISAGWNLTSTNVFGVSIMGNSGFTSIASSNNVFGDNFRASSGKTPNLGISLATGRVVLFWSTNAPACRLACASALSPPVCWQFVTNVAAVVNTNFAVTNTVSSDQEFYRLSR